MYAAKLSWRQEKIYGRWVYAQSVDENDLNEESRSHQNDVWRDALRRWCVRENCPCDAGHYPEGLKMIDCVAREEHSAGASQV